METKITHSKNTRIESREVHILPDTRAYEQKRQDDYAEEKKRVRKALKKGLPDMDENFIARPVTYSDWWYNIVLIHLMAANFGLAHKSDALIRADRWDWLEDNLVINNHQVKWVEVKRSSYVLDLDLRHHHSQFQKLFDGWHRYVERATPGVMGLYPIDDMPFEGKAVKSVTDKYLMPRSNASIEAIKRIFDLQS